MIRLILFALLLLPVLAGAQSVLPLRADTVRVEKVGSNGELQVKNATRTVRGPLSNVGNGVTRFMQTRKSGDTLFVGGDTILNIGSSFSPQNFGSYYRLFVPPNKWRTLRSPSDWLIFDTVGTDEMRLIIQPQVVTDGGVLVDFFDKLYVDSAKYATQYDLTQVTSGPDTSDYTKRPHLGLIAKAVDTAYFFGDSYTNGSNATSPAYRWATLFAQSMGCIEANYGLNASTLEKRSPVDWLGAANMIDRLTLVPTKTFNRKMLVFAFGLNDLGQQGANYNPTNFKLDYDSVLNYVINTKGWDPSQILLIPPYWVGQLAYDYYNSLNGGNPAPTYAAHRQFVQATKETAAKWGVMYIDMYDDQRLNDTTLLSGVGTLHPTDSGYAFIAQDLTQYLARNIAGQGTPTFIPKFAQPSVLVNSNAYDNGTYFVSNIPFAAAGPSAGFITKNYANNVDQYKMFSGNGNWNLYDLVNADYNIISYRGGNISFPQSTTHMTVAGPDQTTYNLQVNGTTNATGLFGQTHIRGDGSFPYGALHFHQQSDQAQAWTWYSPSGTMVIRNGSGSDIFGFTQAGQFAVNGIAPAVGFEINHTDAMLMAKGTTAQRPSSPVAGYVRYTTDSSGIEFYNGSVWRTLAASAAITSYSFTNWLTNSSGSTVKVGGDITESTTLNAHNNFPVTFDSLSTFNLNVKSGLGGMINVRQGGNVRLAISSSTSKINSPDLNSFISVTNTQGGFTQIGQLALDGSDSVNIASNYGKLHISIARGFRIEPPGAKLYIDSLESGASTDSLLTWNGSTQQVRIKNMAGLGGIYGGSGSLPGNVTVTGAGNTLTMTGTQSSLYAFNVSNTGNGGAGSFGADGTGSALTGANSSSGNGILATSSSGNGIRATSTSGFAGLFKITPSSTNTIVHVLKTIRGSSGTPAAGLGGGINMQLTDDAGNDVTGVTMAPVFTSAATGSTTTDLQINTTSSGSNTLKFTLKGNGQQRLHAYGVSTFTGTATTSAQFDVNGNIIEGPAVTSGTYTPTPSNTTNVAASTAYQFQWSRVGNVITFSGEIDIDPTTTATLTVLTFTLPVVGSFGNSFECAGTAADELGTIARIRATASAGTAEIRFTPIDVTNRRFSVHGTYLYIAP